MIEEGQRANGFERRLYRSFGEYAINQVLLPFKLLVPQPVIGRLPLLTTNREIRIRVVLSLVSGRILDIGCGSNDLIKRYRERGGDGVGVDIYPWPGVDLVVKDTATLPYPDRSFDTITFVACINHIANRKDVLREARRLLRPEGLIVLTNLTPRLSRLWHRWAFWDEDQHERGMTEGEVWGFSDAELTGLLGDVGFRAAFKQSFSWGLNHVYAFTR
jgi:SAM-dependent methyltransferase